MQYKLVERTTVLCCADHGRFCEYWDLCCENCTEYYHDFYGFTTGTHFNGTPCAIVDLTQPLLFAPAQSPEEFRREREGRWLDDSRT